MIHAVCRPGYVIAVPFLLVLWVLIAWKAGLFTPRAGWRRPVSSGAAG